MEACFCQKFVEIWLISKFELSLLITRELNRSVFYLNLLVIMQTITKLQQQAALYESKRAIHVFVNVEIL